MPAIAISQARRSSAPEPIADRAARRRQARAAKDRCVGTRRLTEDEISRINVYPIMDRLGKVKGVKLNRLGAPTGYAHVPVVSSTHLDAKGREYRVIHTEIVDLKAEVYARKKAARAAERSRDSKKMRMAA